ncbi:multidrug ABC transporter permease [Cellulomonas sp. Root485]|uniref:ABC transporter permease n=1 Tax=Cellulomonas sp. Root485 TaxID=1736546 RepID=UPI0006F7448E|nr:ABC transporter permease [Cellulomonas sp. Root485]KQY22859.1 multidrug ABC transporter permease [Cellulomonas sp. Root485]
MTTLTTAPPALGWTAHDTAALIDRCLRRSLRQLDTVLLSVILPVMLLLMFVYVFGGAIQTGVDYVNWVVPGIILLTAGYGAANTAVDVASDMTGGIIDRFRSLPIRPTGVLTGHVVASLTRNAVSTALVFGIAFLIGFDAAASPLEWVAAVGLIALYVIALTWVAVAIGIVASGPEAASGFTFAVLFLPYVSSAFVPPETMPEALETIATFNPVTPITDTLRGLLLGTPVDGSALPALLWCLGIVLVGRVAAGLLFRRGV